MSWKFEDKDRGCLVAGGGVKSDDGSFVPTVITMLRSTCRAFYGDKHTNSPASLLSIHTNYVPGPGKLEVVLDNIYIVFC